MKKTLFLCENHIAAKALIKIVEPSENDNVVLPVSAHFVRLLKPNEIDHKYTTFSQDNLPIIPISWQYKVINTSEATKILNTLQQRLKSIKGIIIIGSPLDDFFGRCNNILQYLKISMPVKYICINSYDKKTLETALFCTSSYPRYDAAYTAKERSDWLYGINISCYYSLLLNKPISISRTKTPILWFIQEHNSKIINFKPNIKYGLTIYFRKHNGLPFPAELHCDIPITDITEMRTIENEVIESNAFIKNISEKEIIEPAPTPFSYAELLEYLEHKCSIPIDKSEILIKNLYYSGYISYPYFEHNDLYNAIYNFKNIIENLKITGDEELFETAKSITSLYKTKPSIPGIYPTIQHIDFSSLNDDLKQIYKIIAQRFLLYLKPDSIVKETTLEIDCNNTTFTSNYRSVLSKGWKYKEEYCESKDFSIGENLILVRKPIIREYSTTAPTYFSKTDLFKVLGDSTIFSDNEETTKYNIPMGTSYNRLAIINELIRDRHLIIKNNKIFINESLQKILSFCPDKILVPDYTIFTENFLHYIRCNVLSIDQYLQKHIIYVKKLLNLQLKPGYGKDLIKCPICNEGFLVEKGKRNIFFGCTTYPKCNASFPAKNDKPIIKECPKCKSGYLKVRNKQNSYFWCCSNYPTCTFIQPYKGEN